MIRKHISLATWLLAAELLLGWIVGVHFLRFLWIMNRAEDYSKPLSAAIVFTGDHERVRAGLRLAETLEARRVFISGANPEGGIWIGRFSKDFDAGHPDFDALLKCCVHFGVKATSTVQNGIESACWLKANNIDGPVGLVTSSAHIPRASYALSHFARNRIYSIPVSGETEVLNLSLVMSEYVQYLATQIALLLPRSLMGDTLGEFVRGCEALTIKRI